MPGSGLGLSIVVDIAELYGGRLSLHQAASGGLRARLELPAARPAVPEPALNERFRADSIQRR
jgi:signal transduction histidine kinase